jgi:hypothetical protein
MGNIFILETQKSFRYSEKNFDKVKRTVLWNIIGKTGYPHHMIKRIPKKNEMKF